MDTFIVSSIKYILTGNYLVTFEPLRRVLCLVFFVRDPEEPIDRPSTYTCKSLFFSKVKNWTWEKGRETELCTDTTVTDRGHNTRYVNRMVSFEPQKGRL